MYDFIFTYLNYVYDDFFVILGTYGSTLVPINKSSRITLSTSL